MLNRAPVDTAPEKQTDERTLTSPLRDGAPAEPAEARARDWVPPEFPHPMEAIEAGRFFKGLRMAIAISALLWALLIAILFAIG